MLSYQELQEKVLKAYASGSPIPLIIECFNIPEKRVVHILHAFRENNRQKKSFAEELKKLISERDSNGVARSTIAKELGVNPNTVKRACEEFGNAVKERAISEKAFSRINGKFNLKGCPNCNSKRVNVVEDSTIYCMKCGREHIIKKDHALKVNFEYLD